jgi:hypothetical protein
MAIYLGHTTARRILESRLALMLEPVPRHVMHNCEAGKRAINSTIRAANKDHLPSGSLSEHFFGKPGEPLDVLVPSREQRRFSQGIACHLTCERLPSGSFMQLDMGIYVASPALTLILLAPHMSRIQIIKLAMSFCGIFQLEGDEPRMPYKRKPVATPHEIFDYIDLARSTSLLGVEAVADAMKWVIPHSASPLETQMVLPFYLSRHLGGYGLPRPIMNYPIPLDKELEKIAGQKMCYADSLWKVPGRRPLDLECQSRTWHDLSTQYGQDYARQMALERRGIKVQFVTNMQLNDEDQLNALARLISSHTGHWLDPKAYEWDEQRRKMLKEVHSTF